MAVIPPQRGIEMILASIKPYYYYLIGEGKKKIEMRKTALKNLPQDIVFYMSKDEKSFSKIPKEFQEKYRKHFGKVGIEVVCDRVEKWKCLPKNEDMGTNMYRIASADRLSTCLSYSEIKNYGNGKTLYGWFISDLKIYDKPKELYEFNRPCPDKYHYCEICKYGSVVLSPDEEEYALYHGGYYDCYDTVCHNTVTRPPQSYMYVDEEESRK